ncbi:hypothetical protein [Spirosoma agri]|uniref:Uncharacterized protein n=1 Tax=Spirosoma agri TaxID=1987381 RepID=A0A6M0IEC9_9BACT|nr:hypothetical protein [Spirosoma agri]NEU66112.1 hypothetical protein [Spirosoma agri]
MAFFHVIWILLNIGLAIGLFILSYRNFRLFSERYGYLPSGLLFILTAGMCQSPNKVQEKQSVGVFERVIPVKAQLSHGLTSRTIPLLELPTISLFQQVQINHQSRSDSAQVSSQIYLTGWATGLRWEPIYSTVDISRNNELSYSTSGVFEWRLLSFTIYRQPKFFEGKLSLSSKPGFM